MKNIFYPLYFETNILLIDDDVDFLKQAKRALSLLLPNVVIHTTNNTEEAKKILELSSKKAEKLEKVFIESSYPDMQEVTIDDVSLTLKNANNQKVLKSEAVSGIISTIVVDYDMPNKDGLQFLEENNFKSIKKILLTGVVDENIAINALNEKIIDAFIRKTNFDNLKNLINTIDSLKKHYFSEILCRYQGWIPSDLNDYLNNSDFKEIFYQILEKENIEKYCFVSEPFSIFLKSDKQEFYLFLNGKEQRTFNIEMAVSNKKPIKFLKQLKDKNRIFLTEQFKIKDSGDSFINKKPISNDINSGYALTKVIENNSSVTVLEPYNEF